MNRRDEADGPGGAAILYLADIRFPLERANGIQTFETCLALAERGHDVTLVVRGDTVRPRRDPFAFYGVPFAPRLRVRHLGVRGPALARRAGFLAAAVWLAAHFSRAGCVVTRDLGVASAILRLPRALRPPLVYESHGFSPVFSRTFDELVAGQPPGSRSKQARLLRREQRVWRVADGYVTTTGVLASELCERFGPRRHLATIPNGVRLPATLGSDIRPLSSPLTLAYAGHLYAWKGVDVMISALEQLPDARGLIVGGLAGEADLDRLRRLAVERSVGDRVRFTGLVPRRDVPALLAGADVLVLPTLPTPSAIYTSPLKLFEYFAAGRPVVASDLPPIREIVRDGENGLLFAAGDAVSLADSVRRLVADPGLGQRLARAARDQASAFGWRRRAEQLGALADAVSDGNG